MFPVLLDPSLAFQRRGYNPVLEKDIQAILGEVCKSVDVVAELKADTSVLSSRRKFSIPVRPLQLHPKKLISTEAKFGDEKVGCLLSCGKFPFSSDSRTLDLLEHLEECLPRVGRQIGLVTYQNGIMNTLEDFRSMGELIRQHFPGAPLSIGLHNPKLDLLNHLKRVKSISCAEITPVIGRTFLMFKTLIHLIRRINPDLLWVHIMHSEGGGIGHLALEAMAREELGLFKKNLITLGYGPLLPISQERVLYAKNTYSDRDTTTGWWGQYFKRKNEGYEIFFTPALNISAARRFWGASLKGFGGAVGSMFADLPPGDHSFGGETYQTWLKTDIDNLLIDLRRKTL